MIHHADCSLPKPWNGFGVRDLGVRVWGGGSSGRKRVGVVRSKLMREREKKERDLNVVGPKTVKSVQPVRPVRPV